MKKKRIIIVDDCKVTTTTVEATLTRFLRDHHIEFKSYTNPKELYHKLISEDLNTQEYYDLLICDINMPEMNGLDLILELMDHNRFKNKPIVVLSTESDEEVKMVGNDLGVNDWIVKPFDPNHLVNTVSELMTLA